MDFDFLRTNPRARKFKRFIEYATGFSRYSSKRLVSLLELYDTPTVCDIGANSGQFGVDLHSAGFKGKLISYEPAKKPFADLMKISSKYSNWEAKNLALGDKNRQAALHIASNHGLNSSFLLKNELHQKFLPSIKFSNDEYVEMVTFKRDFSSWETKTLPVLVKLDVQGYELQVLKGFGNFLKSVDLLFLEISLMPLYEGESELLEILSFLSEHNHFVKDIFYGARNKNNELMQIDVLTSRFLDQKDKLYIEL